MGVRAEQEHFVDCPAGPFDLDRVLFDDLPGVGDLPVDALLLGLEQVERYGVGVAGLDELLLLVAQLSDAPLLPFQFTLLPGLAAVQLYVDQLTDLGDARKVELDVPPLFFHLRL